MDQEALNAAFVSRLSGVTGHEYVRISVLDGRPLDPAVARSDIPGAVQGVRFLVQSSSLWGSRDACCLQRLLAEDIWHVLSG
jgi:hypothetical protein